jgi:hypothetical protein
MSNFLPDLMNTLAFASLGLAGAYVTRDATARTDPLQLREPSRRRGPKRGSGSVPRADGGASLNSLYEEDDPPWEEPWDGEADDWPPRRGLTRDSLDELYDDE